MLFVHSTNILKRQNYHLDYFIFRSTQYVGGTHYRGTCHKRTSPGIPVARHVTCFATCLPNTFICLSYWSSVISVAGAVFLFHHLRCQNGLLGRPSGMVLKRTILRNLFLTVAVKMTWMSLTESEHRPERSKGHACIGNTVSEKAGPALRF